jgi:thiosulfate/3-mercaptopyruvate sulfurtransferase
MSNYSNLTALVSTQWVDDHKNDPDVVVVEVDVDTNSYDEGHIPGAVGWNWNTQLCDTVQRDIIKKADLEMLLGNSGISNDTIVTIYGDQDNWFAAWAFWQLKLYRHHDVRLMDGGRKKWIEEGRELTTDAPAIKPATYSAPEPDLDTRAFLPHVQTTYKADNVVLVDVRSPDEFTGKILAPPGLPETCQRGGHIPGAKNIPWVMSCNEDGTFKSYDELKELYRSRGVKPEDEIIAYCRIGERSSHTWFVLKYLLGYPNVKNYDGSWTEWGNLVGAPIEKGE